MLEGHEHGIAALRLDRDTSTLSAFPASSLLQTQLLHARRSLTAVCVPGVLFSLDAAGGLRCWDIESHVMLSKVELKVPRSVLETQSQGPSQLL